MPVDEGSLSEAQLTQLREHHDNVEGSLQPAILGRLPMDSPELPVDHPHLRQIKDGVMGPYLQKLAAMLGAKPRAQAATGAPTILWAEIHHYDIGAAMSLDTAATNAEVLLSVAPSCEKHTQMTSGLRIAASCNATRMSPRAP